MRRSAAVAVFLLFLFLSLLLSGVGLVFAQTNTVAPVPYVYRIDIKGCEFEPKNRRQTGFRVEGMAGIVTALHGVADCTLIDATADGGQEQYSELTIQQVDIARDIVLLSSPELDALPTDGLVTSSLTTTEVLTASLRIVGYPRGLEAQDIDVIESVRDIESLDDVIPDAIEPAAFKERESPALDIQVLNIQAQLLPGHSGAPVIDDEDRVVAIGNGGLNDGSDGRSWAIPWDVVRLQSIVPGDVKANLAELAAKDIAALSFSSTFPSQMDDISELKPYTIQVVAASDGQPIANAEILLTHSAGYEIGVTDSEGFHTFQLAEDDEIAYAQSQLQVEAVGYGSYSRNVPNVLTRVSPEKVRLMVIKPTITVLPMVTPTTTCPFAFLVLDIQSKAPIKEAVVAVILGIQQDVGVTDSTGYYLGQLPCNSTQIINVRVRVFATGYDSYDSNIFLDSDVIEILLKQKVTPTPIVTSTSTSPPSPTQIPTLHPTYTGTFTPTPTSVPSDTPTQKPTSTTIVKPTRTSTIESSTGDEIDDTRKVTPDDIPSAFDSFD